jgi:ammonium transporter, Amt family
VLLGLMASKAVNPNGADGLFLGNATFFGGQLLAVLISSVYAFGLTYLMLVVINKITRVRTSAGEEERGLDDALHGEVAYQSEMTDTGI